MSLFCIKIVSLLIVALSFKIFVSESAQLNILTRYLECAVRFFHFFKDAGGFSLRTGYEFAWPSKHGLMILLEEIRTLPVAEEFQTSNL